MYNCRKQFFLIKYTTHLHCNKKIQAYYKFKNIGTFSTAHFEAEIYLNQPEAASANSLNMEACSGSLKKNMHRVTSYNVY